ncbi:MAG TPA: extracellular solute-binding protein [Acidobacteriaceae bacterium]|nr:extracellular solute-binding protein [Acidobacteriaceae bacterium]
MICLRGMTWRHDRGLAPMLATAAQFAADHPGVAIDWEARSLSEFGEHPVEHLAEQYDLVVLDHPYIGELAQSRAFLALDEFLSAAFLEEQAASTTGPSHASYNTDGHQWALAIDAAAQVTGYRADLLEREGLALPQTWQQVFDIARIRRGFVSLPLFPLDAFLGFCSICANAGDAPFASPDTVVSSQTGEYALDLLRRLREVSVENALSENPIAVWERISTTDTTAYCPLAFGYSNYARDGYRARRLTFGVIPSSGKGPVGATLGGAGLAISARCANRDTAVAYAQWVASADCQRTLYVDSGGQPGNKRAWCDEHANAITNGYFRATLPVLENAWLRPRHAGFAEYQNVGAEIIARFLQGKLTPRATLDELDRSYRAHARP